MLQVMQSVKSSLKQIKALWVIRLSIYIYSKFTHIKLFSVSALHVGAVQILSHPEKVMWKNNIKSPCTTPHQSPFKSVWSSTHLYEADVWPVTEFQSSKSEPPCFSLCLYVCLN